jgi:hypothetical protein
MNPKNAGESGELHSQLFANLLMQQAGMAMLFLGATPHPETGKTVFDLNAAQHFIAQMEMLEAKTKGNLTADETAVLKQSLTTVRMAFVQAVERGAPSGAEKLNPQAEPAPERSADAEAASEKAPAQTPAAAAAEKSEAAAPGESADATPPAGEDERKKFVKKY